MNSTPSTPFLVRPAIVDEIIPLRHVVLRPGLPPESAIFAGDELETTRHWAAIGAASPGRSGEGVIGCLTLVRSTLDDEIAWQLRGMAVADGWRGRGVGRRLVQVVYRTLLSDNAPLLLWCNAREPAVDFYRKLGWTIFSDLFDIPTAGPHYKMRTRVAATPPTPA